MTEKIDEKNFEQVEKELKELGFDGFILIGYKENEKAFDLHSRSSFSYVETLGLLECAKKQFIGG